MFSSSAPALRLDRRPPAGMPAGTPALRSVGDLRQGAAELVGGGAAKAEEFEIGRDLLEQHVGPDQSSAAAPGGGLEQRRYPRPQHDIADQGAGLEAVRVERQR